MSQSNNLLLNSVSAELFAALKPHLRTIELKFGAVVAETDRLAEQVFWPHSGVISLVIEMEDGQMIETAMVGRDGVANGTIALDGKMSFHKAMVQIAGEGSIISADMLRKVAEEFDALRSLLISHEQVLFAQAQQSAGCNATHKVEERMCRWLLRMRDLTQGAEFKLTQEFLAEMLGVQRSSVSLVAGRLQEAGFIHYRRGNVRIADLEAVRSGSCECHERVRRNYERLLAK
jgi:CRP-like cAMP-binding protein